MKISETRTKTYKISEQKARDYWDKYNELVDKYEAKGFDIPRLRQENLKAVIYRVRADLARAGKYSPDIIHKVVEMQAYEGKMSYGEARAFKKAIGITEKISDIRTFTREDLTTKYGGVLSEFWKTVKNNPQEVKRWNEILGTNFKTKEAHKIISNYFFGSK